jgi:hypothetical protein
MSIEADIAGIYLNRKKLKEFLRYVVSTDWAFYSACKRGYLKTARWIFRHFKIPPDLAIHSAAVADQIKIAKWIHDRGPVCFSNGAHYWSHYDFQRSCSKWLWRNFHNSYGPFHFNKLVSNWTKKRELQLLCFF